MPVYHRLESLSEKREIQRAGDGQFYRQLINVAVGIKLALKPYIILSQGERVF
jgi:hypothetical protein